MHTHTHSQGMMDMNEYSFSGSNLSDRMSEVTLSNPANFGAPPSQYPYPDHQMFNHTTAQTMPSYRCVGLDYCISGKFGDVLIFGDLAIVK